MNEANDQSDLPFSFLTASYQTLANDLPIPMLVKDTHGVILFANSAYLAFSGRDLENLTGKSDYDFVTESLAAKYRRIDAQVIESGQVFKTYGEHLAIDGRTLLIEYRKTPVFDDAGNVIAIQFMCWDVTRRENAESALAQERFLFDSLLENSTDLIFFKNQDSSFTRVSKSLADMLGVTQQDLIGKTDADFFVTKHWDQARNDELRIMQTRKPVLSQLERFSPKMNEGERVEDALWFSTTKIPLLDAEQNIVGIFGISRNVTELKRSREKMQNALLMADGANRAKSEFVANMSHEIRTPMNGIIGIAELLSTTRLDVDQREYVGMIQQSSESLMGLLNDILDFSKIEAGKLELSSIPFNLSDSVGKTIQTLAGSANEKGLELACRVSPELPERLVGDPSRLRQVVVNLVGNAIKFTEAGEVVVEVEAQAVDEKIAILKFSVRDTGIGIPQEKQALIFEEFSQADSSTTRRFGGTGLGLTISRQLVELMGGDIWIDGQVQQGTTIHFTAEFGVAEEQPATSKFQLESLAGVPALVVDDNATNRRIIGEMLKGWSLVPTEVDGGVSAITEMQRATKAGMPYRLVLLDCMMPGMDGFSVAELITGNPVFQNPTIIMISSAAGLGDAARSKNAGIAHHMIKPVIKSELFDVIVDAFGKRQTRAKDVAPTASTPNVRLDVLLVEDDLINRYVAEGFLKHGRHDVTVAGTGQEALDRFEERTNSDLPMFDVILMDIQMPELDGFETTALIREKEKGTDDHVPIIAMTAAAMKGDRERCLHAGMDSYLAKPIDMQQMFVAISRYAKPNQPNATEPAADINILAERDVDSEIPSATQKGADIRIDFEEALIKLPRDEGVLYRLLNIFLKECPKLVADFQKAHQIGDYDGMKRSAHTLQGSCRILRASELASISRHLESLAIEQDADGIKIFVPRFLEVASQTCEAMKIKLESEAP